MWRSSVVKPLVVGALGAIVGGLLLVAAIHVYSDHVAFHQLVQYLNQVAPKINQLK